MAVSFLIPTSSLFAKSKSACKNSSAEYFDLGGGKYECRHTSKYYKTWYECPNGFNSTGKSYSDAESCKKVKSNSVVYKKMENKVETCPVGWEKGSKKDEPSSKTEYKRYYCTTAI
jgi:hypothetical protein